MITKSKQGIYLAKMWNLKDGKISTIFSRKLEEEEEVYGLTYHPSEEEIFVTYGMNHLIMWQMDHVLMVIIFRNDIMISVSATLSFLHSFFKLF